MRDEIRIPLSKTKIGFAVLGSIVMISLCIFIIVEIEPFFFVEIVAYCGVAFFGLTAIAWGKQLFRSTPGLIIDEHGVTDHSNYTSVGLIEWADIVGIGHYQVESTKMIIIHTDNPEKYIKRAKNGFAEKNMRMNQSMSGSPLTIISSSLKIEYEELEHLLIQEHQKRL